jgi:dolichol kinase
MYSYPQIVFGVAFLAIAALFVALPGRRRRATNASVLLVSLVAALAVFTICYGTTNYHYQTFVAVASCATAAMLCMLYRNRPAYFVATMVLVACGAIISHAYISTEIGFFGVGTVVGLVFRERFVAMRREDKEMRRQRTEIDRDIFQIVLGVVVLAIMALTGSYAYIVFGLVLLGYLVAGWIAAAPGGALTALSRLERDGVEYGKGAVHLAAGVTLLLGFGSPKIAMFGIAALMLGDAAATIAGIKFYKSRRLPHNRRKSIAGTVTFFVVAALFGAALLGIYGILIAGALAVVESLELPVDDNVSVPIATLLLGLLVR